MSDLNIKAGDFAIINRCLCKINKVGKLKLYFDEYDSYPQNNIWIYKNEVYNTTQYWKNIAHVFQYLTHLIYLNIHSK